ncbi:MULTISPECIES: glucosaminidase domain-containing protein [unclassified Arsukibacterium]|uniref:glucosaminidase domain-containing protein n=1 Tax=unclassified Arsukibacterium TaxID=2635278 RepID=UPI000C537300|nr:MULTISPECIES: glucosaminidase domain-containing protein [unclassified Arsukibacterium]MAA94463.1 flagellar biosynthesis protein FlgJ [Rheinheimera sp.]MBM33474.1 flagellar biosynthesis protein FlgJ [Rheinheimera sp.]HAW91796.1 flagellar biosynthesis protein FlgJ [Candidatus Azambacteria bacterium]
MIKKSAIIVGWLAVCSAALSPFVGLQPIPQQDSLDEWQRPDRIAALGQADKKKVLERLAYTEPAIKFKPLPDFNAISDTTAKKRAFFDYLRPHVQRENNRLRYLRQQLLELAEKKRKNQRLNINEYAFLYSLYDEFRMDVAESDPQMLAELLKRVDILPPSLVLMQAANESAWGTSRFAVEGFNFFGQWCFREGCGLVPLSRGEDQSHEVAKFDSPAQSIRSYFYNLNTFHTYEPLRDIRAKLRAERKPVRGEALAAGLGRYSERGEEYIAEISSMIRFNRRFLED